MRIGLPEFVRMVVTILLIFVICIVALPDHDHVEFVVALCASIIYLLHRPWWRE